MNRSLEFFTNRPRSIQWNLPFVLINDAGARPYTPKPPRPYKSHVRESVLESWNRADTPTAPLSRQRARYLARKGGAS